MKKRYIILSVTALSLLFGVVMQQTAPEPIVASAPSPVAEKSELIQINEIRAAAGKPPVTENKTLDAAATAKAQDLATRHYQAHHLVDESTWRILIKYTEWGSAAENLLWCQPSTTAGVQWWVHSPTHYAAMIGDYTQWGTGKAFDDQSKCWVEVNYFITP
jgi:uncharacterized protein YkwD